jgi:L-threonylcarbamoyladenylate synthase
MFATVNVQQNNKDSVIKKACEILSAGGLVVFPSDTVYGLLVDATNEEAVKKLIQFKNRPIGKAISVFVSEMNMLKSVVKLPSQKSDLLHHLLPGPFTVVLESNHSVSKLLESEKGTLGVRIPNYEFVHDLVVAYGKPVTATSANLGGKSPHYSIHSLLNQLPEQKKQLIDLIVDGGNLPRNKPSTVVDLTQQTIKILRQGDIVFEKSDEYISRTPSQTEKTGQFIVEQALKSSGNKPVVFILQGDLGSGKTVLSKGIGSYLGIEKIVSPTFVVYYEYETNHKTYKQFIHADLYNIEEPEEFKHLGLTEYLKPGNIMVIEWGEKLGDIYNTFKEKAYLVHININYSGKENRIIQIKK